jgi:polyhydroxyalkanoate synthesis regulator phasin
VVVVDGNPTWDALNAAVGAAEEMTGEEALRAARALAALGPLDEVENTSGTSAKRDRIQILSRRLRQLKIKRERLVEVMGRNGVLVKRARLGLGEMRDALRGATGAAATSMRSAVDRMEAFIKRLENKMTEDQGQLSVLDRQIGDIEAELAALGG